MSDFTPRRFWPDGQPSITQIYAASSSLRSNIRSIARGEATVTTQVVQDAFDIANALAASPLRDGRKSTETC